MAQSESNVNDKHAVDSNDGANRVPFESLRTRNNFLQPNNVELRLNLGPDYTTPPNRSVRICLFKQMILRLFQTTHQMIVS